MQVSEPIFGPKAGSASGEYKSLRSLLLAHLQYHGIEGSTQDTIKHKRKEIGQFLRYLEENDHSMLPGDVTLFDIVGHLEVMKSRGLAAASIHTRRRAIHAWFAWMVDWELVPANPVSKVRSPRLPRVRKPFLSESDFHKLLGLCPLSTFLGSRRASMLWLLATTGMRRRELLMLSREDLDWDQGLVRVIHGKGQRERWVPFLLEAQRPMLRYLNNRWDSDSCLWVTEKGRPLGYVGLGTDITRLFQRAEVPVKDALHIFRRTFAANAVRQGVPRQYTQVIAGWSTSQMLDRYTAAMESEGEAIEAFKKFKPFGK